MSTLFGSGYKTAIESYGETASPETIAQLVADWSKNYQLDSYTAQTSTLTGDSEKEVKAYISAGTLPYGGIKSMRIDSLSAPQYANQKEIKTATENEVQRLKTVALANCQRGVNQLGQKYYERVKELIAAGIPQRRPFMQTYLSEGRGSLPFEYRESSFFDTPSLFNDLVLAGLYDEKQITAELMVSMNSLNQIFADVSAKITGMSSEERQAAHNAFNLRIGAITQEDIDKQQQAQVKEAASEEAATESKQALGLIVKTNANQLTITFKKRMMGRFEPGKAWVIQDPAGKSGVLIKAKDELKEKFSAKFYMGASSVDEFPGAWWVMSQETDINDILAVIAKY